jgi:cytochrome c oxidase cbb3-type subunit 1
VHTSAAIFAFGGSALFATSFYVVQRTCRARLFGGEALHNFIFWGYQLFIVWRRIGYLLGITQGKEYAEPEWHDRHAGSRIVWVVYLRGVPRHAAASARSRTSTWPTGSTCAFILTVAMLHLVNNAAMPVSASRTEELLRLCPACRTRWSSGGTATTRWASSSPPASSA